MWFATGAINIQGREVGSVHFAQECFEIVRELDSQNVFVRGNHLIRQACIPARALLELRAIKRRVDWFLAPRRFRGALELS